MISIQKFVFNFFRVNTFVLYDETGECAIIDPGCFNPEEEEELSSFILDKALKPVVLLNTHTHIDHVLGVQFVKETYGLKPMLHKEGMLTLQHLPQAAASFDLNIKKVPEPGKFIEEGDTISFGNSTLEVLYTPGHADGSVCLVSREGKFVIAGDVLFSQSIGRTDLPTGNFDVLQKNIREKLYTLPEDYTVYPGHGPETSIGTEKHHNPFVTA
ncbi:MAG: MBL fold metallo-hydrolase [Bacteroidales bacterium]